MLVLSLWDFNYKSSKKHGVFRCGCPVQIVERLMAWTWAAWLIKVAAKSSRAQWVAGQSFGSVVLLAREITASRCEGGKAPRSAGPRSVLEPRQTVGQIAVSPAPDGVAIAVELGGDWEVGGLVMVGGSEDQQAAEGQGLGCRTGSHQALELSALSFRQRDHLREGERHW